MLCWAWPIDHYTSRYKGPQGTLGSTLHAHMSYVSLTRAELTQEYKVPQPTCRLAATSSKLRPYAKYKYNIYIYIYIEEPRLKRCDRKTIQPANNASLSTGPRLIAALRETVALTQNCTKSRSKRYSTIRKVAAASQRRRLKTIQYTLSTVIRHSSPTSNNPSKSSKVQSKRQLPPPAAGWINCGITRYPFDRKLTISCSWQTLQPQPRKHNAHARSNISGAVSGVN